jgi:hypothetical protein
MVSNVVKEFNQNSIYVQIFKFNIHKLNYQKESFGIYVEELKRNRQIWLSSNLDNPFYSEKTKHKILQLYSHSTASFLRLIRFVNYCKNFYRPIMVEKDLELNNIDIKKKANLKINHYGLYYFTSQDLYRICLTSLLNHSVDFYIEPNPIKNPYNNIPFNKYELYKIYFHLKFNSIYDLSIFHKYFISHFDLDEFAFHNEAYLKNEYIERYVKFEVNITLFKKIMKMIDEYNRKVKHPFKIEWDENNIKKERIVEIFRPYLKFYLKSIYSQFTYDRNRYKKYFCAKLKEFSFENPQFGRFIKVKQVIPNSNPFCKQGYKYVNKTIDKIKIGFRNKYNIPEDGHIEFTGLSASQREINYYNRRHIYNIYDNSNNPIHIFLGDNSLIRHWEELVFGNISRQTNNDNEEEEGADDEEEDSDEEEEMEVYAGEEVDSDDEEEDNVFDEEDEEFISHSVIVANELEIPNITAEPRVDVNGTNNGEEEGEINEVAEILNSLLNEISEEPNQTLQSTQSNSPQNIVDNSGNYNNILIDAFYNYLIPENYNSLNSTEDLSLCLKDLSETFEIDNQTFCNILEPEIKKTHPFPGLIPPDYYQNTSLTNSNEEFYLDNIFEEKYKYEEFNMFSNYRFHISCIERLLEDET